MYYTTNNKIIVRNFTTFDDRVEWVDHKDFEDMSHARMFASSCYSNPPAQIIVLSE